MRTLLLILCCVSYSFAQNTDEDSLGYRNYDFPDKIAVSKCKNILKTGDLDLQESYDSYGDYDYYRYLYGGGSRLGLGFPSDQNEEDVKLFYIGSSADGKVAYTILPQSFGYDYFYAQTIIQDIHTQEILWHHHVRYEFPDFSYFLEGNDSLQDSTYYAPDNLGKYWAKNYNQISSKLFEHKIIQKTKKARKRYEVYNDIKFAKGRWEDEKIFVDLVVNFKGDTTTLSWLPLEEGMLGVQFSGYIPNHMKEDEGIAIFLEVYPLEKELIPENEEESSNGKANHVYKRIRLLPITTKFQVGIEREMLNPAKSYKHNKSLSQYEGYRKLKLTEIISDQIGLDEDEWIQKYGGPYMDFHHTTERYEHVYKDYRKNNKIAPEFTLDGKNYFLAQTRGRSYNDTRTYILGSNKSDSGYISNRQYILHYESDSNDFSYFLDFSKMNDWNNSQINYLLYNSDSVVYIMLAGETPDEHGDFILAYDYKNKQSLWRSKNSSANSLSMCYNKDVLFCGYSDGTDHYINLINRLNGELVNSVKIEFPAKWLVLEGEFLEVFAGRSNYEFKMTSSFFKGYE